MTAPSRTKLVITLAAVLLGTLALPATRARAAECAPIAAVGAGTQVGAVDPELRLRWIDGELGRSAHRSKIWTWGWGIALGAGAVANLAPLLWVPKDERGPASLGHLRSGVPGHAQCPCLRPVR